jgi:hypothetical protein
MFEGLNLTSPAFTVRDRHLTDMAGDKRAIADRIAARETARAAGQGNKANAPATAGPAQAAPGAGGPPTEEKPFKSQIFTSALEWQREMQKRILDAASEGKGGKDPALKAAQDTAEQQKKSVALLSEMNEREKTRGNRPAAGVFV